MPPLELDWLGFSSCFHTCNVEMLESKDKLGGKGKNNEEITRTKINITDESGVIREDRFTQVKSRQSKQIATKSGA